MGEIRAYSKRYNWSEGQSTLDDLVLSSIYSSLDKITQEQGLDVYDLFSQEELIKNAERYNVEDCYEHRGDVEDIELTEEEMQKLDKSEIWNYFMSSNVQDNLIITKGKEFGLDYDKMLKKEEEILKETEEGMKYMFARYELAVWRNNDQRENGEPTYMTPTCSSTDLDAIKKEVEVYDIESTGCVEIFEVGNDEPILHYENDEWEDLREEGLDR